MPGMSTKRLRSDLRRPITDVSYHEFIDLHGAKSFHEFLSRRIETRRSRLAIETRSTSVEDAARFITLARSKGCQKEKKIHRTTRIFGLLHVAGCAFERTHKRWLLRNICDSFDKEMLGFFENIPKHVSLPLAQDCNLIVSLAPDRTRSPCVFLGVLDSIHAVIEARDPLISNETMGWEWRDHAIIDGSVSSDGNDREEGRRSGIAAEDEDDEIGEDDDEEEENIQKASFPHIELVRRHKLRRFFLNFDVVDRPILGQIDLVSSIVRSPYYRKQGPKRSFVRDLFRVSRSSQFLSLSSLLKSVCVREGVGARAGANSVKLNRAGWWSLIKASVCSETEKHGFLQRMDSRSFPPIFQTNVSLDVLDVGDIVDVFAHMRTLPYFDDDFASTRTFSALACSKKFQNLCEGVRNSIDADAGLEHERSVDRKRMELHLKRIGDVAVTVLALGHGLADRALRGFPGLKVFLTHAFTADDARASAHMLESMRELERAIDLNMESGRDGADARVVVVDENFEFLSASAVLSAYGAEIGYKVVAETCIAFHRYRAHLELAANAAVAYGLQSFRCNGSESAPVLTQSDFEAHVLDQAPETEIHNDALVAACALQLPPSSTSASTPPAWISTLRDAHRAGVAHDLGEAETMAASACMRELLEKVLARDEKREDFVSQSFERVRDFERFRDQCTERTRRLTGSKMVRLVASAFDCASTSEIAVNVWGVDAEESEELIADADAVLGRVIDCLESALNPHKPNSKQRKMASSARLNGKKGCGAASTLALREVDPTLHFTHAMSSYKPKSKYSRAIDVAELTKSIKRIYAENQIDVQTAAKHRNPSRSERSQKKTLALVGIFDSEKKCFVTANEPRVLCKSSTLDAQLPPPVIVPFLQTVFDIEQYTEHALTIAGIPPGVAESVAQSVFAALDGCIWDRDKGNLRSSVRTWLRPLQDVPERRGVVFSTRAVLQSMNALDPGASVPSCVRNDIVRVSLADNNVETTQFVRFDRAKTALIWKANSFEMFTAKLILNSASSSKAYLGSKNESNQYLLRKFVAMALHALVEILNLLIVKVGDVESERRLKRINKRLKFVFRLFCAAGDNNVLTFDNNGQLRKNAFLNYDDGLNFGKLASSALSSDISTILFDEREENTTEYAHLECAKLLNNARKIERLRSLEQIGDSVLGSVEDIRKGKAILAKAYKEWTSTIEKCEKSPMAKAKKEYDLLRVKMQEKLQNAKAFDFSEFSDALRSLKQTHEL